MNESPIHTRKSLLPDLEPEDEQDDSWQVSYLDIITIVLGFLIILLSVSQFGKTPMSSLSTLFGKKSDETEYITTPIEEIQQELEYLLRDQIALGNIEIVRDLNDLRVRFKGDDFYISGSTTLAPKARFILEEVMMAFKEIGRTDFNIDVEGHTDNVPIRSSRFPSNWELSSARASNVVNYFMDNGIEDKRLKASGYADSRPVIQYDSLGFPYAAERDMNRRVVLRLYYTADQLRAANRDTLSTDPNVITTDDEINQQADRLRQMASTQPVEQGAVRRDNTQPARTQPPSDPQPSARTGGQQQQADAPVTTTVPRPQTRPEPEVVYTTPPPALRDAPTSVPSFTQSGTECRFSYQFGTANNLSSAFREAQRAENSGLVTAAIWLSGEQFSVRTQPSGELSSLLNNIPAQAEGIVHQCVTGAAEVPSSLSYQIQFGAFQSEDNALEYVVQLFDTFGIQAYMTRSASTYNVVTGPFENRSDVSTEITRYRSLGVQANMFIKYTEQSQVSSGYLYQVQYARASSENDLIPVRDSLGNGAFITAYEGEFVLLSPQLQSEDLARQRIRAAASVQPNLSPNLFLLEFY